MNLPDGVDGSLLVNMYECVLQLVEPISEILADEVVNLKFQSLQKLDITCNATTYKTATRLMSQALYKEFLSA